MRRRIRRLRSAFRCGHKEFSPSLIASVSETKRIPKTDILTTGRRRLNYPLRECSMRPTGKRRRRRRSGTAYPTLAAYLEHSGDSQSGLARALRLRQGYISRVAAGLLMPRPARAQIIANYCGIPLDSFARVCLLKKGAAA